MRVCDNRRTATVPFSSISIGEMFTDGDGDYLMKMSPIYCGGSEHNVVDLQTGEVYAFTDDYQCIKINSAVINIAD